MLSKMVRVVMLKIMISRVVVHMDSGFSLPPPTLFVVIINVVVIFYPGYDESSYPYEEVYDNAIHLCQFDLVLFHQAYERMYNVVIYLIVQVGGYAKFQDQVPNSVYGDASPIVSISVLIISIVTPSSPLPLLGLFLST